MRRIKDTDELIDTHDHLSYTSNFKWITGITYIKVLILLKNDSGEPHDVMIGYWYGL